MITKVHESQPTVMDQGRLQLRIMKTMRVVIIVMMNNLFQISIRKHSYDPMIWFLT